MVGQAAGARDWARSRVAIGAGLLLAGGLSTLLGVALWLAAEPIVFAYTVDPTEMGAHAQELREAGIDLECA